MHQDACQSWDAADFKVNQIPGVRNFDGSDQAGITLAYPISQSEQIFRVFRRTGFVLLLPIGYTE
jgi:hypothetical protein